MSEAEINQECAPTIGNFETLIKGVERQTVALTELPKGKRVHHYEIIEKFAEGGMSTIYRARHVYLGYQVALKTIKSNIVSDEVRARFLREASVLAKLSHSNVLKVLDAGYSDNVPFIVTEHLEGNSVREFLNKEGALSVERTMDLLQQITRVLILQEQHKVIHRDIKPENIFLRSDGTFCLFDYGLVESMRNGDQSSSDQLSDYETRANAPVGTPMYMAPEQLLCQNLDQRVDIFSLGLLAWECLAGWPARKKNSQVTDANVWPDIQNQIPDISSIRKDVPAELDKIIQTMVFINPDERYLSAEDVYKDLYDYRYKGSPPIGRTFGTVFIATSFASSFDNIFNSLKMSCRDVHLLARRVDKIVYLENIWNQISKEIEFAKVVVADFTFNSDNGIPNANVITEAAHARALGKPLIIIMQNDPEKLPFDWRHTPVIRYAASPGGLIDLQEKVKSKLEHLTRNNGVSGSN